jgi:RNA polymerase sporulation-specific sigma factor
VSERDALIVANLDYVSLIAARYRTRRALQEDLIAAGTIGLIQAAERFTPARGLKFRTFARHRIAGAILDYLQTLGPAPLSLDAMPPGAADRLASDASAEASAAGASRAFLRRLREQVLTPLENRVLTHCFDRDRPACELARALGVTDGYVATVKARAVRRMRDEIDCADRH